MTTNKRDGAFDGADDLSDGLDESDEVTVAADSDLLAQIREEAQEYKRERTDDHHVAEDTDGEVTVWRSDSGDNETDDDVEPTTPADEPFDPSFDATVIRNAEVAEPPDVASDDEDEEAEPTMPAEESFDASFDATVIRGAEVTEVAEVPAAEADHEVVADEGGFDAALDPTAVLDTSSGRARLADSADAPASEAIVSIPRVVHDDTSLIGTDAPPETNATYWEPGAESETPRPGGSSVSRRRRIPTWLIAAFVAALIIAASVTIALLVAS